MSKQDSKSHQSDELLIFVKWIEFLKWFLPALEKFPKKSRFTITNRVENIALDIVELTYRGEVFKGETTDYLEK